MENLMQALWLISLQVAALAAVVWVVTRLARRSPASWRHALWVIVLAKFFVPPFAVVPHQWAFWVKESPAPVVTAVEQPASEVVAVPELPRSAPAATAADVPRSMPTATAYVPALPDVPGPSSEPASPAIDWRQIALGVWLVGVLVMSGVLVRRCGRVMAVRKRARLSGEVWADLLAGAGKRLGVRRLPEVMLSDDVSGPLLVGLFRPVMLMPSRIHESCSKPDLLAILSHELAHVERLDMAIGALQQLAQVLFFFHPAVWLTGHELRQEREMACDEMVLSISGMPREQYAAGFISALKLANGSPAQPTAIAMAEPFDLGEKRLRMIMHGAIRRMSARWVAVLLLLAAVGLPTVAGIGEAVGAAAPTEPDIAARPAPSPPKPPVPANPKSNYINPGQLSLQIERLLPGDGVVSAHEPLVAHVRLTNNTDHDISYTNTFWQPYRLEVYDKSGKMVFANPRKPGPLDSLSSAITISAKHTVTNWFVLSALYDFDKPGDYTVRLQLLYPREDLPVRAEVDVPVKILPYDEARLRERCRRIFAPLQGFGTTRRIPQNLQDFPMRTRLQAIYSIRDDAVLGHLSLIARDWSDSSECWPAAKSIRRIGSPAAKKLLRQLAARRDRTGKAARGVAKERSVDEVDEWFVAGEWKKEVSGTRSTPDPSAAELLATAQKGYDSAVAAIKTESGSYTEESRFSESGPSVAEVTVRLVGSRFHFTRKNLDPKSPGLPVFEQVYDGKQLAESSGERERTTRPAQYLLRKADQQRELHSIRRAYINPRKSLLAYKPNELRVLGRETTDGVECLVLEGEHLYIFKNGNRFTDRRRMWIAPSQGYLVVKMVCWGNGGIMKPLPGMNVYLETSTHFKQDGKGRWRPVLYTHGEYRVDKRTHQRTEAYRFTRKYSEDYHINVPIDPAEFRAQPTRASIADTNLPNVGERLSYMSENWKKVLSEAKSSRSPGPSTNLVSNRQTATIALHYYSAISIMLMLGLHEHQVPSSAGSTPVWYADSENRRPLLVPDGVDYILPYQEGRMLLVGGETKAIKRLEKVISQLDVKHKEVTIKLEIYKETAPGSSKGLGSARNSGRAVSTIGGGSCTLMTLETRTALDSAVEAGDIRPFNAPIVTTVSGVAAGFGVDDDRIPKVTPRVNGDGTVTSFVEFQGSSSLIGGNPHIKLPYSFLLAKPSGGREAVYAVVSVVRVTEGSSSPTAGNHPL